MAFIKTTWVDNSEPSINASQLNRIEDGIDSHEKEIEKLWIVVGDLPEEYHLSDFITELSFTLEASNWSNSKYVLTDEDLGDSTIIKILTKPVSITSTQRTALEKAKIDVVTEGNGTVTLQAFGTVPSIDVPILILVL